LFYAIPRRDEVILGGSAIEVADEVADEAAAGGAAAPPVDDALTVRILADAARFGLTHGDVRAVRVGLRPGRAEVRLARDLHDPRIVHCYGHGGAGFTLAWGCAEDVVGLVRTST
ncbi:MAG: FAD-binding oxidoreductase, partial [Myxococcales bacterium]|nr:FAD-binding oxidoreductase [Myxococcales bacterium]